MDVLRRTLRVREGRDPEPSMVLVDCRITKGGRGGPSPHEPHSKYRLCGAKCAHTDSANRPNQATFCCTDCGHTANADTNAAINIAARGRQAEGDWQQSGSPSLPRRKPRRRPRKDPEITQAA